MEDEPADFEDDDFVEDFLPSPSFRTFAGAGRVVDVGCCDTISDNGGAPSWQGAASDGVVGNEATDDGTTDAGTGATVDDGGREPMGSGSGAADVQFGGDTVALPDSSSGCTAVVPFSRTSQFLAGGNIFGEVVAVAGTGEVVFSPS